MGMFDGELPEMKAATRHRLQELTRAFMNLTSGVEPEALALRAATLHMLEGHAPRFFQQLDLGPQLQRALQRLDGISTDLGPRLSPLEAQSRFDAWYLRSMRKMGGRVAPSPDGVRRCLESLADQPVFVWTLATMALQLGVQPGIALPNRRAVGGSLPRHHDLYWLTHLFLVESRLLHAPMNGPRLAETDELETGASWVVEGGFVDLAAEMATCLQATGRFTTEAHQRLLGLVLQHLAPEGCARALGQPAAPHPTAAALLALGGALERGVDPFAR